MQRGSPKSCRHGALARHKRAGRIEERDGKLYAMQSTGTMQRAAIWTGSKKERPRFRAKSPLSFVPVRPRAELANGWSDRPDPSIKNRLVRGSQLKLRRSV